MVPVSKGLKVRLDRAHINRLTLRLRRAIHLRDLKDFPAVLSSNHLEHESKLL